MLLLSVPHHAAAEPVFVTEADFSQKVVEGSKERPVLVFFWTAWCGPCRVTMPNYHEAAEALGDRVAFVLVDADASASLPQQYDVRTFPTFVLFQRGAASDSKMGGMTKDALIAWIGPHAP